MPLRHAAAAVYVRAKRLLEECGFTEAGLADPPGPDDPKGLLASLFLQAMECVRGRAECLLGDDGIDALIELGLLESDDETVRAAVLLYPLRGLHIASDIPHKGGRSEFVFPAISGQTHEYLSILPEKPCRRALEIGTGSGAAALLAADYAEQVTATDVSRRCLDFAEFNRRLNAIDNVEIVAADVYDGLPEGRYDLILSHPPYVPWTGVQEAYRHGGPDGEAVLRRLLAGLSDRLAPGGRFYAATLGCDTEQAPLERRVREMLGPREAEFDILVVERELLTPLEFIVPWTKEEDLDFEQAWKLNQAFRERGIERLVRCSLAISWGRSGRPTRTMRRRAGAFTASQHIEQLLDDEGVPGAWREWSDLLATRPRLMAGTRLETFSQADGGSWRATSRVLIGEQPFWFRSDCPEWAAEVLAKLNGVRTLADALGGYEPEDEDEAATFIECLFQAGVLRADED